MSVPEITRDTFDSDDDYINYLETKIETRESAVEALKGKINRLEKTVEHKETVCVIYEEARVKLYAQIEDLKKTVDTNKNLDRLVRFLVNTGDVQTDDMPNSEAPEAALEWLAEIQHNIWSAWMLWMLSQGSYGEGAFDGAWLMPADKLERWKRQANTPYNELSESEKNSDRNVIRNFLLDQKSKKEEAKNG